MTATDHLATVRAALDLAGKATPGPWAAVDGATTWPESDDADLWCQVRDASGQTIAHLDESGQRLHHRLTVDAAAIVALRNAAPAIADLCREVEALRSAVEERDGDMHMRIRAGYDKTIADAWRAEVAKRDERIATLEAELWRATAPITDDLHPDGCHTTATAVFRDCSGDGHHECRTCTRFDEAERAKRIGEF